MNDIPGHALPTFAPAACEDALFHYTTASGLIGIFRERTIWSTAYHCANDKTELAAGKGVLDPLFRTEMHRLTLARDPRIVTFHGRGVDPMEYAANFEGTIIAMALSSLSAFLTSFCKPNSEEDFHHGLLSQWRGYGPDGGYALQFSRQKVLEALARANQTEGPNYELQDVYYGPENPLRTEVLNHANAYLRTFSQFLNHLARPLDSRNRTVPNFLAGLLGGPLEAFLDYLIHTKSKHFGEERECRLSLVQAASAAGTALPIEFFNRGGLLVPYTRINPSFNILECVEWIVVGPGPRMGARFKSVSQLIRQSGFKITPRPSHIPFTRF